MTSDQHASSDKRKYTIETLESVNGEPSTFDTTESRLQYLVQFQRLVSEIAARFVNLPFDDIEEEIECSQRRICEYLNIDRSTIWISSEKDSNKMLLSYIFQPIDTPQAPKTLDAHILFPWTIKRLLEGDTLVINKRKDLPPDAAVDSDSWKTYSIKSTVTIPLSIGNNKMLGVLSFGMMRHEVDWDEMIVEGLQLVAQVFKGALDRIYAGQIIRRGETQLSLAEEVSGVVAWSMDIGTKQMWVAPRIRKLFGLDPEKKVFVEDFLEIVPVKDRERLRQAIEKACEPGGSLNIEYNIRFPGDKFRWILTHGSLSYKVNGDPDCLTGVSIDITEKKNSEQQLVERLLEIERLKQQLEHENIILKEEIKLHAAHDIVGQSDAIKRVLFQAEQVAPADTTVLIVGETGTGKELLARAIHKMSVRSARPMVTVNCASLPPTLIESELFGREKGAYTGAMTKMIGRFEAADNSSLFLDEIGELSFELQNKLLRVLEEGVFERLGSTRPIKVNFRLIVATNRNLADDVKKGRFRKDLYYRLNVFPIIVPPLRERPEDIPLLVWAFVNEFQQKMGKRIEKVTKKSLDAMKLYAWPGNVRELRNVVERAMIGVRSENLDIALPKPDICEDSDDENFHELERKHILKVLEKTMWKVTGRGSAAEILGLKRSTLQSKMKKLGIKRPTN